MPWLDFSKTEKWSHRFERGHVCLLAAKNGTFAGFVWFAREIPDEDEVHCRFVLTEPEIMRLGL